MSPRSWTKGGLLRSFLSIRKTQSTPKFETKSGIEVFLLFSLAFPQNSCFSLFFETFFARSNETGYTLCRHLASRNVEGIREAECKMAAGRGTAVAAG